MTASLQGELERILAARGLRLDAQGRAVNAATGKRASALPARSYFTPTWSVDALADQLNADWFYFQQGDYDLNGEVNIADLTPLGLHFGKNPASPDWSAAQVADGDGNGEINIADVTPIGMHFGVQVYGYVIETADHPGDSGSEFGFMSFNAGLASGNSRYFAYSAPGGLAVTDVRVAPVGPPRDFVWTEYQLTDTPEDFWTAELCLLNGNPAAAFTSYRDPYGSRLGFAMSSARHPDAVADWTTEYAVALDYMGHDRPALASVAGEPAIAYFADASPAADLRYLLRDAATGHWSSHIVTTFMAYRVGLDLTTREGRPAILVNDGGLLALFSGVDVPTSSFDWGLLAANPGLVDFVQFDAISSGAWLFVCGVTNSGANLAFNRSKVATPMFQSDFSEFAFGSGSYGSEFPSIALSGGKPVFAFSDGQADCRYLESASRQDDSAALWSEHVVKAGASIHALTEYPEICLLDGRPAIVAGHEPMTLYWANGPSPAAAADWHVQAIGNAAVAHSTHSMLSVDGRPVIAYQVSVEATSTSQVAIAVAQEN